MCQKSEKQVERRMIVVMARTSEAEGGKARQLTSVATG